MEIATRPKPRQSFCQLYGCLYLKDLNREKSAISINPFNNTHLYYNNWGCTAARYPKHSNYELYYFNGWDKGEITDEKWEQPSESEGTNQVEHLKPCSVVIHQGLFTSMDIYILELNWFIDQPIKNLLIFGENSQQSDCNDSYVQAGISLSHLFLPQIISTGRIKNKSAEIYEPGFVDRNQSELAMDYIGRGMHRVSLSIFKFDYLSVAVFHKLNCPVLLADSLCLCTMLTHLTYVKCVHPTFDTLGKNKELKELTVENCSLGLNTEAELYAQLGNLKHLEKISFKGMKYEKQLARITRTDAFSSLTSLKILSLQNCMLTTPTAVAVMKSLVQCPLVEIDLSNNFLFGFIKELHQTPDVSFRHLERMKCSNSDLLKADTMALAGLISENRLSSDQNCLHEEKYLSE